MALAHACTGWESNLGPINWQLSALPLPSSCKPKAVSNHILRTLLDVLVSHVDKVLFCAVSAQYLITMVLVNGNVVVATIIYSSDVDKCLTLCHKCT